MGVCINPPKLNDTFSEDDLVSAFGEDDLVSAFGAARQCTKRSRHTRRSSGIFLSTKRKSRVSSPKSLVTSTHKETLKKCHGILHDLAQCKTRGMNWNHWINEIINHLEEIKLKTIAQEASDQAKELLLAALTKGSEEDKEIGLHFRRLTNMVRGDTWRGDFSNHCHKSASLPLDKDFLVKPHVRKPCGSCEKTGALDISSTKKFDKNPEIVYLLGDQKRTNTASNSFNFGQFRPSTYIAQFPGLKNVLSWNFDLFGFSQESNSRPLSTMFLYICVQMNIESAIPGINLQKMSCFMQEVESNYGNNPYHNFMHGADVLHSSFNIMQTSFCDKNLDLVHRFTLLFASAVHDFSHPGVSNDFLVNTGSKIATTYNDTSVLENWHTSQAFSLLKKPEFNFLEKVDAPIKAIIRTNTIEAVLMTDMKRHGEHVKELQQFIENRKGPSEMIEPRKLITYALHVSDLSHPTKRFDIHMEWSRRLANEFLAQGDRELELGMEPGALFDRRKVNMEKGQIGFIEFIILPLWINWTTLIGADDEWINQINLNKEQWRRRAGVESQEKESRSSTPSDIEVKEEDKGSEFVSQVRLEDKRLSNEQENEEKNTFCNVDESSFSSMSRLLKPPSGTPSNFHPEIEIKGSASKLSSLARSVDVENIPQSPTRETKLSSKLLNSPKSLTVCGNSDCYIQESREFVTDPSSTNLQKNPDSILSTPSLSSVSYEFSKLEMISTTMESSKKLDWAKINKFERGFRPVETVKGSA